MLLIVGASGGSGTSEESVRMNESCYCFDFFMQVNEIFLTLIFCVVLMQWCPPGISVGSSPV